MSLPTQTPVSNSETRALSCQNLRRSANYKPSQWDDKFIQSIKSPYLGSEYKRSAEMLKEKVLCLFEKDVELTAQLELVDTLERLGIGYHFEKEIKEVLTSVSVKEASKMLGENLYATALMFRLLREHGFRISQDVFSCFKDERGHFKACLVHDTKGMLSLYEASHLAKEGEITLDEAWAFTKNHLKDPKENMEPYLKEMVDYALELLPYWRTKRSYARWYIEMYERKDSMNSVLLELAKLDFNMVQAMHQTSLRRMSRWWKDLGLTNKLSFARDRLMECFIWAMGITAEPKFSYCREVLTQVVCMVTIIDDIYDVYGSLEELEHFTDIINRWDNNAIDQLPDYMKICFMALHDTTHEICYKFLEEKGFDITKYLQKEWASLCNSYLVEAKWYHNKYIPTLEEYLENAWISIAGPVVLGHAYFLTTDVTADAPERLSSYSSVIRWASTIVRLCDDLGTSKEELARGDVPKSIQCYMNEKGTSEAEACQYLKDLVIMAWKKLHEESTDCSPFHGQYINIATNAARAAHFFYTFGDWHGSPNHVTKRQLVSLLIEPF